MRAIGWYLFLLGLAFWVGGGILYTFVLTPAIFAGYPRDAAGAIVGTMMPGYFLFVLAAIALVACTTLALRRTWTGCRRVLCLSLALAALAIQGFVLGNLYPRILEVKSRVASFEANPDAPGRREFRRLHGASMALNLLLIADGMALLGLACGPGCRGGLPKKEGVSPFEESPASRKAL